MYPHDIHTWSCFAMLLLLIGHVSPFWYSDLVRCLLSNTDISSWITVMKFSLDYVTPYWCFGHLFQCWLSHFVIYHHVNIDSWSCIEVLIFTLGHECPCCYSYLVIYSYFHIHSWSYITILIASFGQVSLCWYLHLVM